MDYLRVEEAENTAVREPLQRLDTEWFETHLTAYLAQLFAFSDLELILRVSFKSLTSTTD